MRPDALRRRGRALRHLLLVTIASVVGACGTVEGPGDDLQPPSELVAEALGTTTIRVSWKPAVSTEPLTYELERRTDLQGDFTVIAGSLADAGGSRVVYFDTDVEPGRFYGYRVRAISRLGALSSRSNVSGTRSAPTPGLEIRTVTTVATASALDADGYRAVVRGPRDTTVVTLATTGVRLISPIADGTYSVALQGLSANCAPSNAADSVLTAVVRSDGPRTITPVTFSVSCRDPARASIVANVRVTGDTLDADGVTITTSGIIRAPQTPPNERVYFQTRVVSAGTNSSIRFDNLLPGDYEVSIGDVDAPCVLTSARRRELQPAALAVDTVRFSLACTKPEVPVDTVGRPFVLRNSWSASAARPGDAVSLLAEMDLRADATQRLSSITAQVQFDADVVRYDSISNPGTFDIVLANNAQPGVVLLTTANLGGNSPSGRFNIARLWYTVIGTVGSRVRSSTTVSEAVAPAAGGGLELFTDRIRTEESTLEVSSSGAGPTNQPPVAAISGPGTATVGTAVTFSGSQSSDPDGTIASYAWTFGDGASGSGVSASHTYQAAGSYTVRLTVTDNRGATGTREQNIVVSAPSPSLGSITGTVSSPTRGALAGVTVTVAGGGSATTSATGTYTISGVAPGQRTVMLSGLPATCAAPTAATATVTAGASATLDFSVTCTTGGGGPSTGTMRGRVTRVGGDALAGVRVSVQPAASATALSAVTDAQGDYSIANVPVGTGGDAGRGAITLSDLPTGCSAPTLEYTGLTAGGSLDRNIEVTCQTATTGTITGTVTRSTGGPIAGAQIVVTPTGSAPLAAVTTTTSGGYTVSDVPAGGGTIAVNGLPTGCTAPAPTAYSGLAAGASLTRDITVTCVAAPFSYPVTATWGAITTGGATGRTVELTLAIDMGGAPGRPDVNGSNPDDLSSLSFSVSGYGTNLNYVASSGTPSGLPIASVNQVQTGTPNATTLGAVFSLSGSTQTGAFTIIRLRYEIAAGFSGTITPIIEITEATATVNLIEVTATVSVGAAPALTVP